MYPSVVFFSFLVKGTLISVVSGTLIWPQRKPMGDCCVSVYGGVFYSHDTTSIGISSEGLGITFLSLQYGTTQQGAMSLREVRVESPEQCLEWCLITAGCRAISFKLVSFGYHHTICSLHSKGIADHLPIDETWYETVPGFGGHITLPICALKLTGGVEFGKQMHPLLLPLKPDTRQDANPHSWPWLVSIMNDLFQHSCEAIILGSDRFNRSNVLLAPIDCIHSEKIELLSARGGLHNTRKYAHGVQVTLVTDSLRVGSSKRSNPHFVIITTRHSFLFSDTVRPVRIASRRPVYGDTCVVAGWRNEDRLKPQNLQQVWWRLGHGGACLNLEKQTNGDKDMPQHTMKAMQCDVKNAPGDFLVCQEKDGGWSLIGVRNTPYQPATSDIKYLIGDKDSYFSLVTEQHQFIANFLKGNRNKSPYEEAGKYPLEKVTRVDKPDCHFSNAGVPTSGNPYSYVIPASLNFLPPTAMLTEMQRRTLEEQDTTNGPGKRRSEPPSPEVNQAEKRQHADPAQPPTKFHPGSGFRNEV